MMGPPWDAKSISCFIMSTIFAVNLRISPWHKAREEQRDERDHFLWRSWAQASGRECARACRADLERLAISAELNSWNEMQPEREASDVHHRMGKRGRSEGETWRRSRPRKRSRENCSRLPIVPFRADIWPDAEMNKKASLGDRLHKPHQILPSAKVVLERKENATRFSSKQSNSI